MDHDELHDREESRVIEEFTCRSCGDHVSGYAAIDPIRINGFSFCDHCANNFVALRIDGYLDQVSVKTKRLVQAVDDANGQKLHEQEYDKSGKVKHL